jgi:homoserine O-acetyltransferase
VTQGEPVVIFHALTGDSHVTSTALGGPGGWWERVVGPRRGIDTERFRVLGFNMLGGAMGSTGPSSPDAGGEPWGSRFPVLSIFDLARAAHHLIREWTDRRVHIVGGSMGGMVAYAYAALYPDEVAGLMAIGAPIRHEPWAIAFHTVGRAAIASDPNYCSGDYYGGPYPEVGLAQARMSDMISYQHPQSLARKFGRKRQPPHFEEFEVASYLAYQGRKLVHRFDANTYMTLTRAMDEFSLTRAHIEALRHTPVWMVGMESDLLYLPEEIQAHHDELAMLGVPVRLEWLSGPWGHDTFLVEQEATAAMIARFLAACRK